jgi:hypothetical protein
MGTVPGELALPPQDCCCLDIMHVYVTVLCYIDKGKDISILTTADSEHMENTELPPPYALTNVPTNAGLDRCPVGSNTLHEYEIHHTTQTTSSLHIKQNGTVLYYAAPYIVKDTPDLILYAGYNANGPQLALAKFTPFSKDFKIYIGGSKSSSGDDWDTVRCSDGGLLTKPSYRFESSSRVYNGQRLKEKFYWQKTSDSKLGASKMSSRDFKLVHEESDEVVAVYVERYMGVRTHKGTITYRRNLTEMAEMAALVALLSLLEKSRRHMRAVARAFPP